MPCRTHSLGTGDPSHQLPVHQSASDSVRAGLCVEWTARLGGRNEPLTKARQPSQDPLSLPIQSPPHSDWRTDALMHW